MSLLPPSLRMMSEPGSTTRPRRAALQLPVLTARRADHLAGAQPQRIRVRADPVAAERAALRGTVCGRPAEISPVAHAGTVFELCPLPVRYWPRYSTELLPSGQPVYHLHGVWP